MLLMSSVRNGGKMTSKDEKEALNNSGKYKVAVYQSKNP